MVGQYNCVPDFYYEMVFKHQINHEEEALDGIVFRTLQENDLDKVVDFYFEVFLKDEPSSKSFGGNSKRHPSMVKQILEILQDGVSLIAVDPKANGKVVGLRASYTIKRKDDLKIKTLEENLNIYPVHYAFNMTIFDRILSIAEIFTTHPDIQKVYNMFALACHPDYRSRGIASQLIRQALKVAKKCDCDFAVAISTSIFSRRIFDNVGFETLKNVEWSECGVDGCDIFSDVGSNRIGVHGLRLVDQ